MKQLPSTRRGLYTTVILILLGLSAVAVVYFGFINGNFDFRNRAGFKEDRWTLDELVGQELKGAELKELVDKEVEYAEDVQLNQKVKDKIENVDNLKKDDPDLVKYKERFGVDSQELIDGAKEDTTVETKTGVKSESKSLIQKASAATNEGPTIGKRDVPTVDGFNVDTFTGTATLSYPVGIPPIRGNISFSEGLTYSSRNIDELRVNKPNDSSVSGPVPDPRYNKNVNKDREGYVGLGWNLTSQPTINIDSDKRNEYILSMGGRNIRIKYNSNSQTFYTYPKTDYQITRLSGGRWKVVDLSGTVYVFGTDDTGVEPWGPVPTTSATYYVQKAAIGSNGEPYFWTEQTGWKLSKIGDLLGNTLEIDYEQAFHPDAPNMATKEIYVQNVRYNYNTEQSRYLTRIDYEYSMHTFSSPSQPRTKLLDRIVMKNDGLTISAYNFIYNETFKNQLWGNDGYFLLTRIEKKGFGGNSGNAKPYTFCYQSLTASNSNSTVCDGTDTSTTASTAVLGGPESVARNYNPNNIYVVKANNGYGGEVEYIYEYRDKIDAICANIKQADEEAYLRACTDDSVPWGENLTHYLFFRSKENYTGFYRVSKVVANNDSYGDLREASKLKVTKYEYIGNSYGYASDFGTKDSHDRSHVLGLQFLGYSTVRTTVYEPASRSQVDSVRKFLTKTEQKSFIGVKKGSFTNDFKFVNEPSLSCYMVDPRKGMVRETNILDQAGNAMHGDRKYGQNLSSFAITYTSADTRYRVVNDLTSECNPVSSDWAGYEVFPTVSSADAEGKKSKTEVVYDFQMQPGFTENHGLPIKQINYGNPDVTGDETYSYTKYINASNLGGQSIYDRYLAKNLFALPSISFSSKVNANTYAQINSVPAKDRSGQTRNYYDGANDAGGQVWQEVKGLITQSVSTITQVYPNNVAPEKTIAVKTDTEYNSYWMPKRITSSDGTVSDTFYDSIYNSYPICQIQWKSGQAQSYSLANCYVSYSQKGENVNAFVTKSFYNENPSSLTQPNNIAANNTQQGLARGIVGSTVDPNGGRTDYEYDEYGRVVRVFNSDPTQVYKTQRIAGRNQDYANQYASYFDTESFSKTRVTTRLNTKEPGVDPQWKTTDTLVDGFGNEIQTIAYDLHDKTGTFRSVSHTVFNGIGQVEKKYDAVRLSNIQPPAVPQLISLNEINNLASTGTVTETQYDFHSRPIEVKTSVPGSGLQTVESTSYDGYIARATNSRNVRTVTESDAYGNVIRTVEYLCDSGYSACNNNTGGTGITTRFEYDRLLGKPTKVIDPQGVTVQESYYDTAGNVIYSKDLDRGTSTVYFDSKGRVNKVVDAKGVSVNTTTFDGLNRPKVVSVKNASNEEVRKETYIYDGQMLGTVSETKLFDFDLTNSALQITTSEADLLGRTTKSTTRTLDLTDTATLTGQGDPKYITQEKTENFSETGTRLQSETKIASALTGSNLQTIDKVGYTYDLDGKLIKSTDKQTNTDYINNINYNHKGQPDVVGLGNNSQERYSYDAFGRMTRKIVKSTTNNNTWFDVNYKYETINNNTTSLITQIQSNIDSTERNSFLYDSLGRLQGTADNTSTTPNTEYNSDYLYDILGNITEKTEEEIGGSAKSNMNDPRYFSGAVNQYKNGSNGCIPDTDYIQKTGYNAQVDGCPYHALKRADLDKGNGFKRIYYLYDKKGNIIKEVNVTDNTSRVYEYSVLDLPISVSDYNNRNASGDPESKSFYVYGFGAIRVGKVLGSDTTNPPPQNDGSVVVIDAKGNNAGGEWSKMQLKVNGQMLKEWTVDTSEYSDEYRFTTSTPIDLTNDRVEVYFVNDWYRAGVGDRNLWVAYIEVDGDRYLTLDTREGRKMWSHGAKWTSQYLCNTEGYMLTDKISCNGYFRLPSGNTSPSGESGDQGSGNTKSTVPENTEGTTGGTSNPILDKINSR